MTVVVRLWRCPSHGWMESIAEHRVVEPVAEGTRSRTARWCPVLVGDADCQRAVEGPVEFVPLSAVDAAVIVVGREAHREYPMPRRLRDMVVHELRRARGGREGS